MTTTAHRSNNPASLEHHSSVVGKRKTTPRRISSAVNIDEGKDEYIVYVVIPGMQRNDFGISINEGLLIISADKQEALHCFGKKNNEKLSHWKETVELPENADTVMTAAIYRNGELQIHIPKGERPITKTPVEVIVY
jgi:HSP20 family protein